MFKINRDVLARQLRAGYTSDAIGDWIDKEVAQFLLAERKATANMLRHIKEKKTK